MTVVRTLRPLARTTRAENVWWNSGEDDGAGTFGAHGFAENGDPMHLGEGPP
jgi:hypothetical protein